MTTAVAGSAPATPRSVATSTPFIAIIVCAAAGIAIGLVWDISWHMTIGRDTFWSPPHMLEYVSGLTAGISCGYVVLQTTFAGSTEDRGVTVRFWGFRGPLGAWITIWGTFAMLVSAPFDDWWHNAYGLDVKIVSPPHALLFMGMLGIVMGALALTAAAQNRSAGQRDELRDAWLYAFAGGVVCLIFTAGTIEYSWPNNWHTPEFYGVWAIVFPILLVGYARAGRLRYPAAAAAIVSMTLWFLLGQVFRHVPAEAHLAPIWNPRTYLWPPYFPVLLVVPALGIDVIRKRLSGTNEWLTSLALGATFVALLLAVQWPMAYFMVSPAAHNAFFNSGEWPYFTRLGGWSTDLWTDETIRRSQFLTMVAGAAAAMAWATISSRIGLYWGSWMSKVRR